MNQKLPLPPFTQETALLKVQLAEDAWNSKDPERIVQAYTVDSEWRNRSVFLKGRKAIKNFLKKKWKKEHGYKLKKELWSFTDNRIAVCFEYEWHDNCEQWHRSYGNEMWNFDKKGLMAERYASINDELILQKDRRL